MPKVYCFDCDNTLCYTRGTDYEHARPYKERISKVNALYDKGNTVWIFTGRGSESGIDWRTTTEFQLKEWGVKYHKLIMGKPAYDVFVDDLAHNTQDWFRDQ